MKKLNLLLAAVAAMTAVHAVETKTWTQSDAAEFDKGTIKGLALRSDGRVTLAPAFRELHDPAVPHLWSIASGRDGVIYAAGAEGKVFAIGKDGKGRTFASFEGGAVYAVAVGAQGDVFAAVSPDAKVYRIQPDGKATLFHTSKAKYIWAIVPGEANTLFVATGEPGQIHRVAADGQASVVYDAGEAHVRSLARDAKGDLYAGTEPDGLIIRVSRDGQGFVLHQTSKREVTSLAVAGDGAIWAAASGRKQGAVPQPAPPPPPVATSAAATAPGQAAAAPRPAAAPPPTLAISPAALAGGGEVWRILPDGEPRLAWSSASDIVYALALGPDGRPVLGTGNQGYAIRIESDTLSTRIADAEPSQITAIAPLPGGGFAVAAANPGRVYRLGPELEKEGTLESDIFDAASFTYWGRLRTEATLNGGAIKFETRSGNVDRPDRNWSPWAAVTDRIPSPPSRFLVWRATLAAAQGGQSPELSLVEAAYQQKNVAPLVDVVEITPYNYRFSSGGSLTASSGTLSLPPIGQKRRGSPSTPSSQTSGGVTMNFARGYSGARWKAADANGDSLSFKLEIRGVEEREWKLLKEELEENRYSFDATGFADGRYVLRVTATDQPDNYPGQGLTAQLESEPFLIDNTPPQITGLAARLEGSKIRIAFQASDALSSLSSAEFSVNGGEWIAAQPTTRMTDSLNHRYEVETEKPATGSEFVVAVRVTDERENVSVQKVVLK